MLYAGAGGDHCGVGGGIVLKRLITNVWIGEHVQDVDFGFLRVEARIPRVGRAERGVLGPVRLPFGFDRFERVVGQGKAS